MGFRERKEFYIKHIKGKKQEKCIACNGTGYYDDTNSPTCESCNGTGKIQKSLTKEK